MANHHEKPPQVKEEKKPRLFYYEEAVDGYIVLPDTIEKAVLDVFDDVEDGDEIAIRCAFLTDAEVAALPEVS
jgi:hypothetical protein